jgi:phage-related protein
MRFSITRPFPPKKLNVVFFATNAGNEPVREWLIALPIDDRKKVGQAILEVQIGWPLGLPLVRPMGRGLFEVRVNLPTRIARVLFSLEGTDMVLLHAFIKKQQATPDADLDIARTRKAQI